MLKLVYDSYHDIVCIKRDYSFLSVFENKGTMQKKHTYRVDSTITTRSISRNLSQPKLKLWNPNSQIGEDSTKYLQQSQNITDSKARDIIINYNWQRRRRRRRMKIPWVEQSKNGREREMSRDEPENWKLKIVEIEIETTARWRMRRKRRTIRTCNAIKKMSENPQSLPNTYSEFKGIKIYFLGKLL